MLAINYAFFALLILNLGGTSPNLKSFKDYNPASNTKLFKQDSDSDSCIYIILKLLSKSDFRKDSRLQSPAFSFDSLTYAVDNIIGDSLIIIHAYLAPEPHDSEPHDRTVAWLQINLKKMLLEDITIDDKNPEILNSDKTLMGEINIDCLTKSNKKYFQEMNK